MKKCFFALFLTLAMSLTASENLKIKAVVITPVADLLGQPYKHSPKKNLSMHEYYHDIPFSGSGSACWRVHQLLFNEMVTVLDERGDEVKVKISNFYYIRDNGSSLHDTYWTLKKNLLYLDKKSKSSVDPYKFPPPISYQDKAIPSTQEQKVVTIKKPFYDSVTQTTYSAGTRFLAFPNQDFTGSFDRGSFKVYIFDARRSKLVHTQIPKLNCIRNYFTNPEDKISNFVQVLRSWTIHNNGFIPYVLGGFSWTHNCEEDQYEEKKDPHTKQPYFHRSEWSKPSKVGFDCVGMIGRAAQICDIPFFYKNTLTLMKGLDHLKKEEELKEGDLITYPGHVIVVSSLEKNLIIEAGGYDHGHGRVIEIPINKIFKEASSFSELTKLCREQKPLTVISPQGKVHMVTKNIKLLKLESLWSKP